MTLATGRRLTHYEILGPLGAGGMGEVYRARDTRLEREVAIKVLPEELADDEERLRRFEREAKTLASLNHPNVAGIHGVDQEGDVCFLALELVPGEDLAARLSRGALPVDEAIDVCRQIAEGLEAAHEAGVVHRDLKPANVRITPEGVVKILDFGLAKPIRPRTSSESETRTAESDSFLMTEEGLVLGTPTYMSPEQARGRPVDRRTDIWAFGCVLFECLTGKRVFGGEAMADILGAIVGNEPEWSALPVATPPRVRALLQRCLDKDLRTRLRDIGEARVTLTRAEGEPFAASASWSGTRYLLVGAGALVLGLVLGAFLPRPRGPSAAPAPAVIPTAFRQVSDLPGREHQPSLSPDGKSIVYVSEADGGDRDVFLQRVEGRTPINLTADSPVDDYAPAFSPDGESIAFRSDRNGGGIFVMGATGESVRRVTDFGYDPAWSPDGAQLAVTTEPVVDPLAREFRSELWVVALDGRERRRLTAGDAVGARWSPDGRRIAYWGWRDPDWQRDVFTIAADGSEPEGVLVTDDPPVDWSPAWTRDGSGLYFGSNRGGTMNLWRIDLDPDSGHPVGAPRPITTPSPWSGGFAVSADGSRLVYATRDEQTEVWTVDFDPEAGALVGTPRRIFGGRAIIDLDWSPGGDRLVLIQRGDPWESMAIIRSDGTGYTRITDASIQHRGPHWSPVEGSERILFYSNVYLMTIRSDGSDRRAVDESSRSFSGFWSGDGRRVLAMNVDEQWNPMELVQYAVDQDGLARRIDWTGPSIQGRQFNGLESWSSDGEQILIRGTFGDPGLHLVDVDGETVRNLLPDPSVNAVAAKWLPDSRRFIHKSGNELFLFDLDTLEEELLLEIERDAGGGWGDGLSLSKDGRQLAYLERRGEGDVWLMDIEPAGTE